MNAAQLLVSCLESEGVRFAFGIPGEENLELMDALRGSSVRFVLTRHEGAAAEKSGSTNVEHQENVAEEAADPDQKPLPREPVSAPTPARASVEQAALLIEKAVRPVILAGNGVIRNGSSAELTQFAER